MLPPSFDPDLPALRSFMLPVGSGHVLHVQEWGRACGIARWLVVVDALDSFAAHGSFEVAQVAQVA
ncbi:MAG: hypothetical protein LH617_00625 [Ramlibacter sp.]|nr:hypothetical protein [Ramlibacter sp.]